MADQLYNRRTIVKGSLALAAGATLGSGLLACSGKESTKLRAVTWGEPYLPAMKTIGSRWMQQSQSRGEIEWQLNNGTAASSLSKIGAGWPDPGMDMVAMWSATYAPMVRNDWLEPINLDLVPNLADIPDKFIFKNSSKQPVVVPFDVSGALWATSPDFKGAAIADLDALLEPEFRAQLCIPNPIMMSGLFLVTCAYHAGGDERNIDPGFDFIKKLARAKSIGRIATTDQEFINSFTTGETSATFWNFGGIEGVKKKFPITVHNSSPDDKGLRTYVYTEGWTILKDQPNVEKAMKFANFFISPENNAYFAKTIGLATTNQKAKPSAPARAYLENTPETGALAITPDFEYMSSKLGEWNARWDKEIAPLV